MPSESPTDTDFFVSYTGKDEAWAEWIAWQLEEKGYQVLIQAWDFKSGGVFPGDMHRALQNSARVIAVLTPDYMDSGFCQPEWQAAFAMDPTGEKGILVCVRVADFKPNGILTGRTYIDLVRLSEGAANETLLRRLETGRAKPPKAPSFPGSEEEKEEPPFPGESAQPAVTASPLHTTIPHNLPRLQPFFGREEELAKIADALDPDSRTWGALIDGPGGMGKTSLAVRAAYDASPEVFGKIIFISLKTRELDDDGVRDLSGFILSGLQELWNELARELDRDDLTKVAEDERPRLLLATMRDTRTLLLLDNLESLTKPERDTLFTFVKKLPAGCKAILTSRGRIGSGAEEIILEKFTEKAALQTLAELATHNPLLAQTSEAERLVLYRETGGSPLLLRWTAGQLGRGHCLTFTDALEFLGSCPEGNDPLEFVFGDLVEDFSDAEIKVLSALTYFTLPAEVKHIHAIADASKEWKDPFDGESDDEASGEAPTAEKEELSLADAETALRSLANRSLAVPTDELKAFTLVPMVAAFLRKKRPELVAETGDRLEKRAYALIIENGYKEYDRFPALEAAWPGIAPALPRFLAGDNACLQIVCDALTDFLNFRGRWDERLALSEKAESVAVAAADHENAGWRAYQVGFIHSLRQQADAVLASAGRAATHWETAKAGACGRAAAIQLRGHGHRLKADYPAAIAAYREVLDLHRSLDAESENVATSLNWLAVAEDLSGDRDTAEGHYREALRVARAVNCDEGVATYTGNLAGLALDREDWPAAEALAREALPLSEAVHRQELIASDNSRLAVALVRQGRAAEALPHAQRAEEIYTRLGSPDLAAAQAILDECEEALGEDEDDATP